MVIENFIEFINKKYGLSISSGYYSEIDSWKRWYESFLPGFHEYSEVSLDGNRHTRKMYRLSMAKTICEDWASMLLNDKTVVNIADDKSRAWLLGQEGTNGALQKLDFWNQSNRLVEAMMRSGTAAWVVSVDNMAINQAGKVIRDQAAEIALDFLPAECILPITVKHGKITECAFASEVYNGGKAAVYLQIHTKEPGGYKIENRYFISDATTADQGGFKETELPAGMAPVVHTGMAQPWFSVITPNVLNNISDAPKNGLGLAIYANAADQLKMVDSAYNNYVRDIRLGGKKLFYNKKLIRTFVDESGESHKVAPDDVQQQLFWTDGTSDPDTNPYVYDYNPSLRAAENHAAVQDALNYLSMKCGMGGHFYIFEHDAVSTATQYKGDKATLIQSIDRHQITIEAGLISIIRAILEIARDILGEAVDPSADITVSWDRSFLTDDDLEREQMRRDVTMHMLPAYKYIQKWYGVSEEEAKELTTAAEIPALMIAGANQG